MTRLNPAPRPRWLTAAAWAAFALVLGSIVLGGITITRSHAADTGGVVLAVLPHPDDEFQVWSMLEDRPSDYKVFLVMTRGENTGSCDPAGYAQAVEPDEPAPNPMPTGRGTVECAQARMNSLLGYLSDMSRSDPTIPGDFGDPVQTNPFPAEPGTVCRTVDGVECAIQNTSAEVWVDRQNRGAVVSFDLGDGDLTEAEATWAITTTLANRAALGIDSTSPPLALVGAFANTSYDCFPYPHPDHVAVQKALWDTDYGAGLQAAATCANDPDEAFERTVSDESVTAAFQIGPNGERLGAHVSNYGWLFPQYYQIDRTGQNLLFTQHQYFWTRFNE